MFKKIRGIFNPKDEDNKGTESEKTPELIPVYEGELPEGYELLLEEPGLVSEASLNQKSGFFELKFSNSGSISIFDQDAVMVNDNPCHVQINHNGKVLIDKEKGSGTVSVQPGSSVQGIVQSGGGKQTVSATGSSNIKGVKQSITINK